MALLLANNVNQFGTAEEYWKVLSININAQYKYTDIVLGGYATQETRDNGCEPLNIKKVRAKWDDVEYGKYFSAESYGIPNPMAYIEYLGLTTQEEIEQVVFQTSNIFERAYYYVKDMDAKLNTAANI